MMNVIPFDTGRNFFDIMDSVRIQTLMLFPKQDKIGIIHTAHLTNLLYLQCMEQIHTNKSLDDVTLQKLNITASSFLHSFFKNGMYEALKYSFLEENDSIKSLSETAAIRGLIAGDILRRIIRIDKSFQRQEFSERASVAKAIHLLYIELSDNNKRNVATSRGVLYNRKGIKCAFYKGGKSLPISPANLETFWSTYKNVSHFWAAYDDMYILCQQKQLANSWVDKEYGFINPSALERFFAIASFYKDFAVNYIPSEYYGALLNEKEIWSIPVHFNIALEEPSCIEPLTKGEIYEITHGYTPRK